jgi:predicted alpha/beta superfamily hydrolase
MKPRLLLSFLLAILCAILAPASLLPFAAAQPVAPESLAQGFILIVQDKSGLSSAESPLYFASNWGGWAPGDGNCKLTPRSDMRWQIILKPPAKDAPPLEFKITRGSWEQCEVAADLSDIPNRQLQPIDTSKLAAGEQPKIEITVEKFADQRPAAQAKKAVDPYRTIEVTGTLKRLSTTGGGVPGQFRDCLVWLPPGYDDAANAATRYPVLYMQDGQNLFEKIPGLAAEWGMDETATDLITKKSIAPIIIVGIPNAGPERIIEYLPFPGIGQARAGGDQYVNFLIHEVIPRTDSAFRTKPGPENRAIGGSSLGGLISLYAAAKQPDIFGKVLAESPSLVLGKKQAINEVFSSISTWPSRIYLAMGGKEANKNEELNNALLAAVKALDAKIAAASPPPEHKLVIEPDAVHNEAAWAKRLPAALEFLFPPEK